ncbi:MAG TPA: hypothetical protein DHI91_02510, partial [Candidatus Portnoybacteria bacterium]|nr:hypothetical protein [Candidatus Portnoybacteria bacterium]
MLIYSSSPSRRGAVKVKVKNADAAASQPAVSQPIEPRKEKRGSNRKFQPRFAGSSASAAESRRARQSRFAESRQARFRGRPDNRNQPDIRSQADKRKPPSLKIIPLGGMEEVGRNMTIFEYGDDIVILDMGIQFPEEDMPGIDYI